MWTGALHYRPSGPLIPSAALITTLARAHLMPLAHVHGCTEEEVEEGALHILELTGNS